MEAFVFELRRLFQLLSPEKSRYHGIDCTTFNL